VKKRSATPEVVASANGTTKEALESAKPLVSQAKSSEWDYKVAFVVTTILAFITRFWGINHPDQVVFDEVHFGKVRKILGSYKE
jgi:dolichyl-phosphate-mannose-protein mannosyltransferase